VEEFKLTNLFNTNGSEQFNAKVFESNANYRLAIMEAVRIAYDPDDPCSSPEEAAKNASLYAMALKLIRKHEPVRIHSFFRMLGSNAAAYLLVANHDRTNHNTFHSS